MSTLVDTGDFSKGEFVCALAKIAIESSDSVTSDRTMMGDTFFKEASLAWLVLCEEQGAGYRVPFNFLQEVPRRATVVLQALPVKMQRFAHWISHASALEAWPDWTFEVSMILRRELDAVPRSLPDPRIRH
jgi:hypothetical protein